jgi:hypothetical protein
MTFLGFDLAWGAGITRRPASPRREPSSAATSLT